VKPAYELSRRARQDLRDIGRHSQREWGLEQRDIYLRALHHAMERNAVRPGLGVGREDILPGLRCLTVGRHHVYYRWAAPGIIVLRILHQRMDPYRHLIDSEDE